MMKLFRNPETAKTFSLYVILSAAFTAFAYLKNPRSGLFTGAVCIVFTLLYLISAYGRYKKIYDISMDIDRILHGGGAYISLDKYSEGEISALQCKIQKMTVRLREQRQRLKDDKIFLADSLADISHQIRTPLTSVNLLIRLLSDPEISGQRRLALTRELLDMLSRIDWLITVLLKISRLDAGIVRFKKEKAPLSALLKKAAEPLLISIELREQALMIDAEGEFTGDILWTQEAVGNILKNCMEHTQNGGEIRVKASENALYSEVIIADNGGGIDKKDLPHVFERFYKGENSNGKGFGIGLSLARMIITGQGGTVKAQNSSSGAIFTVRFYKGDV